MHNDPWLARAMQPYGGLLQPQSRLPQETAEGFAELLQIFRGHLEGGKSAQAPYLPTGDILVDFVDNRRFNAIATAHGSHEGIGIYYGSITLLFELFHAMLSDPMVFPEIGEPSRESNQQKPISLDGSHRALTDDPHAACPTRLRAALNLAWCGSLFLFCHEVAHITRAHLRLLRQLSGSNAHHEVLQDRTPVDTRVLRTLEFDADETAAGISYRLFKQNFDRGWMDALGPLGAATAWAAAASMVFRIINGSQPAGIPPNEARHPAAELRQLGILYSAFAGDGMFESELDARQLVLGERAVELWWRRTALPLGEAPPSDPDAVADVLNDYRSHFKELLTRLQPLAEERAQRIRSGP
jgi:hypothetical protein